MLPDQATSAVNPASCTAGPGNGPLADIAAITEGMSVGLTEAAARHITRYIGRRGKGVGIRLGVKTTGCSGLAYKIEFADEAAPEDIIFEQLGVKILVDPKSLPYIDGTELDFVREGLNEGFKFNNPNERDRCGCGESFRI
jgi:iron-sulfur cluster assembly protein